MSEVWDHDAYHLKENDGYLEQDSSCNRNA